MGLVNHITVPVLVWADIDEGIADMVRHLNEIPGVRTAASCQGTIGEGGPEPFGPFVQCSWSKEALERLDKEFNVEVLGSNWGYVRPRELKGTHAPSN